MDPSRATLKSPPSIDNNQNTDAMDPPRCDISDSLNRLSLSNATATPLPNFPSLLSPDASSHPSPPNQPALRRTPSSSSLRNERRKSIPALQKTLVNCVAKIIFRQQRSHLPARRLIASLVRQFHGVPDLGDFRHVPAIMPVRLKLEPPLEPQEPHSSFDCGRTFPERG